MSLILIPDGPGTTVELRDGAQGLPSSPRGTVAIMGQYASGPVDKAALALTPEAARLISGQPHDEFDASLALDDVYAYDSPIALIARVTDGTEIASRLDLWGRGADRSFSFTSPTINVDRAPLATISANNGGRWGGRKRVLVGDIATPATDFTATTVDLSTAAEVAATMLQDIFAGALLYITGDSSSPYTIASNNTAGVATIVGEFSDAVQAADGTGAIDGTFYIVLDHDEELSVVIGTDSVVGERFSLTAVRKFALDAGWEVVSAYDGLGLSTDDEKPWTTTIPEVEADRYQISLDTDYDGSTVEDQLPCNFSEVPVTVSGATLTYQWYRWSRGATTTGNGYLSLIGAVDTGTIEPHTYDLTFSNATTAAVVVTWPDGSTQSLGNLTVGSTFNPTYKTLTAIKITAGSAAFVANDTFKIRVMTLPHDLSSREAFLYPVGMTADGNASQRLRIVSNTYNSVTVRSDIDLADYDAAAGTSPEVLGTANLAAVSLVAGQTVILTPDGMAAVTLTSAGSGPGVTAIAAELEALDTAGKFVFDADPDNPTKLRVRLTSSFGSRSSITVGNGTANATLGITNGAVTYGDDAVPFRIEARWPMWGGYDGVVPGSSRYVLGLDLTDSLFKCHLGRNLGLVRVATPGITATAVKSAAAAFVALQGWLYIAEFASSLEALSLPGEGAVDDMVSNESTSDYVEHYFPSRGKFLNVARTKLVTRSISGVVMGLRSRLANVGTDGERGLHIAAANNNEQGRLSPRVRGLSDDIGRWTPPVKLLNDHGIVPVIWNGPDVYLYGNRMYSQGRTPAGTRYTITERAVHYHVARDLFITTRPFIFKSISARRLGDIQVALRTKMKTYFIDGWFSDFGGTLPGFEQQVLVEVPLSLNPPESLLEGLVTATVTYRPRPALENLHIIISPLQITAA